MTTLAESIQDANAGRFQVFTSNREFRASLTALWRTEPRDESFGRVREVEIRYSRQEPDEMFSLAEPEPLTWSVAFTPAFRKSVADVDKKLQGRVLVAIAEISEQPNKAHGDTMKPLVGELKGLWRYRVGDYRLVYEPKFDKRLVILLHFESRGGVYEQ